MKPASAGGGLDAQTEDLLVALAERNIHSRGDLELALAPGLERARRIAKDRYDDLRFCNKTDDCDVLARGAELVLSDIEYEMSPR